MKTCIHRRLAKAGNFSVDGCSCGTINLHVGAISLRLDPQALAQLAELLNTASERYQALSDLSSNQSSSVISSASSMTLKGAEEVSQDPKQDKDIH